MAISREDKKDVKNAMGKAIANKVAKVTRDKKSAPTKMRGMSPYSSSKNSGHDDNYLLRKGKGTYDDPYTYN